MLIIDRLEQDSTHFIDWLRSVAIPHWAGAGVDELGASYERFLANGQPDLKCDRRVRVQSRQMFVFSVAQQFGWIDNGARLISHIDNYMTTYARNSDEHHFVHLLDAEHKIKQSHQDLYDVAFLLLAYGWRYHVFRDLHSLDEANRLLTQIDKRLKEHPGGWKEGDVASIVRRQNPHMHLFEAFLTLYQFTNDAKWLAKAGEMYCLFETRFYRPDKGILLEYFTDEWTPAAGEQGHVVEPGHMLEWVWLLREYQRYTLAPVDKYCNALYDNALSLGITPGSDVLIDHVDIETRIPSSTKRCWPMTEWIKAACAQAKATGEARYLRDASCATQALMTHFVRDTSSPLYADQLDSNDQVISQTTPASTLYHLVMAAIECDKTVKEWGHGNLRMAF